MDGENTYQTGRPCRNGHIAYRYTQSGACVECIKSSKMVKIKDENIILRSQHLNEQRMQNAAKYKALQAMEQEKKRRTVEQQAQLSIRYFVSTDAAWPKLREAIIAVTLARCPDLTSRHILGRHTTRKPMAGGTGRYAVYINGEDFQTLNDLSRVLDARQAPTMTLAKLRTYLRKSEDNRVIHMDGSTVEVLPGGEMYIDGKPYDAQHIVEVWKGERSDCAELYK